MFSSSGNKADSVENLLNLFTDGGNTDQLNNTIQTSIPSEAVQLHDDLVSKSPYLSDTAMITAITKENVLDPDMITNILSYNPQAAKSENVMNEVDNRINQLTDDQMDVVMQGLFITGAKEVLQQQFDGYKNEQSTALYNMIRYYLSDSTIVSVWDSIYPYLDASSYLWAKYTKAFAMSNNGDSVNVGTLLDSIEESYSLTQSQMTEHQHIENYLGFVGNYISKGESIFQPDSSQVLNLASIAEDSTGIIGTYAKNLLIAIHSSTYKEPYILPTGELKDSRVKWIKDKFFEQTTLKLYPNPAKLYVVAEYTLKGDLTFAVMAIVDNLGKPVRLIPLSTRHNYLVISLSGLPNGIYICKLVTAGNEKRSAKFIINN